MTGRMLAVALICVLSHAASARTQEVDREAAKILEVSGIEGGLVVHLNSGDGRLTAALRVSDRYIVHGLGHSAENVQKAREHARRLGLGGRVTFDMLDGNQLPLADNIVNLLVAEDLGSVPAAEVQRVLAPRGVALTREAVGGTWLKTVKPWPAEIDEWSHFLHDPSGNAVADDSVVGAPKRLQWIGGPMWSRSHEYDASLAAMVTSGGRLFYIFDEGPTGIIDPRIPDKWMLIARDAFNGVVLWKREIPDWGWKAWKRAEMEATDWSRMKSQRFQLPISVSRRIVGAGDRLFVTLGYQAPLTAVDAAGGETLKTYRGTEHTDEILYDQGRLIVCIRQPVEDSDLKPLDPARLRAREADPGVIAAIDAESGRRLWQTEPSTVVPLTLAMNGRRVVFHDGEAIVCLDATNGEAEWRTPTSPAGNAVFGTNTTVLVHKNTVLYADRKKVAGLSLDDGRELWTLPGARGFGVGNPPDLFVADGLLWYGQGGAESETIVGFDPLTGKPARTVEMGPVITHGHHSRCYRSKATENYLLLPKRAVEFIDIKSDNHSRHNWARGACRFGVLPANGLLYGTPHPCFCYAGVKLGGFLALSPESVEKAASGPQTTSATNDAPRLVKGPAHIRQTSNPQSLIPNPSFIWPTYRHDPKRSGGTSAAVDHRIDLSWQTKLGGKLTQPIAVGSRVYVARADAGEVCCLDADTGAPEWHYTTGGRVDSAPSYYQGTLIFGSADGWVYCLRASDGTLVWRYRAAPVDRRLVAFGQVESAWPVHGSVLILDDVVYFVAGRSSFLDGGLTIFGLDPSTGQVLHQVAIDGPHPDTDVLDEKAYAIEGAKSDILVSDGRLIYLFHNVFNRQLEQQPTQVKGEPGVRNLGERDFPQHLFSNAGFLDDSWFSRNHWMHGDCWTAFNFTHQSPKAGQLVVFDDKQTYAVKCFSRRNMLSPLFFPETDGYFLVADDNDTEAVLVKSDGRGGPDFIRWLPQNGELQTCWNLGVGFARSQPAAWTESFPVRIRAMVATADALFAAGTPDVCDPEDPLAALEGRRGARLLVVSKHDGAKLAEYELASPPVFDGLIAVAGRLYLSTEDGNLLSYTSGSRAPH